VIQAVGDRFRRLACHELVTAFGERNGVKRPQFAGFDHRLLRPPCDRAAGVPGSRYSPARLGVDCERGGFTAIVHVVVHDRLVYGGRRKPFMLQYRISPESFAN
jgi:hypothetical protein